MIKLFLKVRCENYEKIIGFTCVLAILIIVTFFVTLRIIILSPLMFWNCTTLDAETNREIKVLVLQAVKSRCSSICNVSDEQIFDRKSEELLSDASAIDAELNRSIFCIIDPGFMNTVTQDEDGYNIIVKMVYPEPYYFHFTVKKIENKFMITTFELDI